MPNQDGKKRFSVLESTLLILFSVCLVLIAATTRWCWLLLDEQIQLRNDFEDLRARQEQVEIQYEFWLEELESDLQRIDTGG